MGPPKRAPPKNIGQRPPKKAKPPEDAEMKDEAPKPPARAAAPPKKATKAPTGPVIVEDDIGAGMSPEDIGKVVEKKSKERTKIQKEIEQLTAKREAFLAKKAKQKGQEKSTLNDAVLQSLRKAAAEKGFKNP